MRAKEKNRRSLSPRSDWAEPKVTEREREKEKKYPPLPIIMVVIIMMTMAYG
jgi:hypothetical protein